MYRKIFTAGLAGVVGLAMVGCSLVDSPTGPQTSSPEVSSNSLLGGLTGTVNSLTGTVTNLVGSLIISCDKLPQQTVAQVIGSQGGKITVGPHTLTIPAGALKQNVRITASITGDKASTVQFGPEGLKFQKQASLTMSYAHCKKLLPLPTRIVYTTDNLKILELLRSLDNRRSKTVTSPLDHFSKYAIAYRDSHVEGDSEEGFTSEEQNYYY